MLFKVGNTDYTTKIRQGTYVVNSYDSYSEWTDANYKIHRSIVRSQLSGSFTMYFGNQTDFQTFLNNLESVKLKEGLYQIGLQSNNRNEWCPYVEAFIDFAPTRQQKVIGEAWFPELKVTIKES